MKKFPFEGTFSFIRLGDLSEAEKLSCRRQGVPKEPWEFPLFKEGWLRQSGVGVVLR